MRPRPAASLAVLALLPIALPVSAQQAAPLAPAQAAAPAATITVKAQLVNLPVVVRDKNGALVQNLTKDDFALAVDGQPQTIRYFDKDNDLPLTLGLLVDTSGSVRSALDQERTASEAFLDQMMRAPAIPAPATPARPPDQAFLIQFAREADLLQDLTASRPQLREALNRVGTDYADQDSQDRNNSGSGGYGSGGYGRGGYGGHRGFHGGGGTKLYDAIYLASAQLMQKQHGRKALVVLTDGEDRGSIETLQSAIAAAQRAETVVYAIYFKGEQHGYGGHGAGGWGGHGGYPGGRGGENHVDGKKVLAEITGETGGRMFDVSGKQTFDSIYTQIADELRSQYRLGYIPDAAAAAEGFHRVDLTLKKDKKLFVQTRNGYYAGE
ncbi:MAG TPA: VWA domain-containing protein [Acidobacteriaceae bacterium]|nr:VWA domain-containing protein [Acidobacteriaceae bacterium]